MLVAHIYLVISFDIPILSYCIGGLVAGTSTARTRHELIGFVVVGVKSDGVVGLGGITAGTR